jgi:REP-associated tyrosine transposase
VVPGVAHHVTQRGNNRQDVFFTDDDRGAYLSFLRESAGRCGLSVQAYCLMTNHVHLIATPETEASLAKTIGRTHLIYAQYIHRLHGRLGHFWQNRFYSCPMDEAYLHNATAYVELNPVRAGMADHAWEYAWSSAAAHCGAGGDPSALLNLRAWFMDVPAQEWSETLEAIAASTDPPDRIRLHTRTGRPLGSDSFLSKVEALLGRRVRARQTGRPKGSKDTKKRKRRGTE